MIFKINFSNEHPKLHEMESQMDKMYQTKGYIYILYANLQDLKVQSINLKANKHLWVKISTYIHIFKLLFFTPNTTPECLVTVVLLLT